MTTRCYYCRNNLRRHRREGVVAEAVGKSCPCTDTGAVGAVGAVSRNIPPRRHTAEAEGAVVEEAEEEVVVVAEAAVEEAAVAGTYLRRRRSARRDPWVIQTEEEEATDYWVMGPPCCRQD